jgi:hypothetical protein
MVELHSNYTPVGQKYVIDDVYRSTNCQSAPPGPEGIPPELEYGPILTPVRARTRGAEIPGFNHVPLQGER